MILCYRTAVWGETRLNTLKRTTSHRRIRIRNVLGLAVRFCFYFVLRVLGIITQKKWVLLNPSADFFQKRSDKVHSDSKDRIRIIGALKKKKSSLKICGADYNQLSSSKNASSDFHTALSNPVGSLWIEHIGRTIATLLFFPENAPYFDQRKSIFSLSGCSDPPLFISNISILFYDAVFKLVGRLSFANGVFL